MKWQTSYEHAYHISVIKKVYDEARNLQHAANQLGIPYNDLLALRDLHGWPKKDKHNRIATPTGGKRMSIYDAIESGYEK